MMKKTFFGKFLAIAMIFAGFSLTSCDEKDNAIIDGQVYVKPEVQFTDGEAVITATTISDINKMIAHIRKDVMEYAAENPGEPITIKIDAPALTTTLSENTIGLPTTKDVNIIVEFTNPIATSDDAPLIIQSMGVADNATPVASTNEVEINFAAGTSDIDLGVNMPTSTVTLKGATIDELVSKTALNTLILENGVTVNWLQLKGGKAVVKEGAEVLGGVTDQQGLTVYKSGINLGLRTTDDDTYWLNKVKLINGDYGNAADEMPRNIISLSSEDEQENEIEIVIADGVKAWVDISGDPANAPVLNITGEGDATIMTEGWKDSDGKIQLNNNYAGLDRINKLSNVTVGFTRALVWNSEDSKYEALEVDTASTSYKWCQIELPVNSENCTFNAKRFTLAYNIPDDVTSSTHKSDTFNSLKSEEDVIFSAWFPVQNDKRKSFTLAFDSCEFDQATFNSGFYGSSDDFKAYKAYISFDSSKIGGKAVTKSTNMIYDVWNRGKWDSETSKYVYTTETFYTIDGVNYKPVYQDDKWYLVALD